MSDQDPVITRRHLPSAIWFLPLLAAIIAGWLVYKNYSDKGVEIDIIFDSAAGLEANKTKVLYRGLPAGVVKELTIDQDLRRVRARVEMVPETADTLTHNAQFWLVKPQVSLSGVRGLETLLSGHYIGFQPGLEGDTQSRFEALDQPPPPVKNSSGLYLTLVADSARSVYQGAKVYYRDIEVGEVLSHALSPDGKQVQIETYIEPRFTYLIKTNTRFWNASGIKVKADLPKLDIQIGSLASIIAGGIHFSTPDETAKQADNGLTFSLYDDYEDAQDGIPVTLRFPGATNLSEGTLVESQGITIGRVTQAVLTDDFQHLDAHLLIDPRAADMLREGSRFWLQKPEISLQTLSSVSTLLKGSFIEMEPGQGPKKRDFTALDFAPAKHQLRNGTTIELRTSSLGSIDKGSPILFRQLPVGEVIDYQLSDSSKEIIIKAAIEQRYQHLIKPTSRFWNASGVRINASLEQGVQLTTESASALFRGGIAFFNPVTGNKTKQPAHYSLFSSYHAASDHGKLADSQYQNALRIRLHTESAGGLSPGDPILYKRFKVGELVETVLDKDGRSLTIYGLIEAPYRHLINDGSRFWDTSGVTVKGTLKEIDIRTESLASLVSGGVAFENDFVGEKVSSNHLFTLYPDRTSSIEQPLRIEVDFPAGRNIKRHADVRYKGQIIGKVSDARVINSGTQIRAGIDLFRDGHFLAAQGSSFWVVEPVIRLSAIENPAGVLTGNYIESMNGQRGGKAQFKFTGLTKPPSFQNLSGLNITIHAPDLGSIIKGSPILYRKMPVGSVTGYDLTSDGKYVEIFINVKPEYAALVKQDSVFTNASGVNVDLSLLGGLNVRADSLETIIGGGLSFTSPEDSPPAQSGALFNIDEM